MCVFGLQADHKDSKYTLYTLRNGTKENLNTTFFQIYIMPASLSCGTLCLFIWLLYKHVHMRQSTEPKGKNIPVKLLMPITEAVYYGMRQSRSLSPSSSQQISAHTNLHENLDIERPSAFSRSLNLADWLWNNPPVVWDVREKIKAGSRLRWEASFTLQARRQGADK